MKTKLLKQIRKDYSIIEETINISKLTFNEKLVRFGVYDILESNILDANKITLYYVYFKSKKIGNYRMTPTKARKYLIEIIKEKYGQDKIIKSQKIWYKIK